MLEYPVRNIRNDPEGEEITHIKLWNPLPFIPADVSSCSNDLLQVTFTPTANMFRTLCLTVLFLSCLTSAASIRHAANIKHPRARTAGSTSPQPDYACTNDIDWFGDRYNTEDCMAAVQRLWNTAVSQYQSSEFEFLAPGATNKTTLPTIQTPQRYSSGQ